MESAVFKVDVRAGTVRIRNALFLGSTYAVTIEGYDYVETPPTIMLSDHKGNPLAVSEVDEQDGHIISLDTQELLDYFKKGCMKGCVKVANVHCTVNTTDATLASSTMLVFWSQYYTAPSGTLTKIDVKGPKGDPGDTGPKGDKGDDGAVITARGFFHFTVSEDSHLWVHASREHDLYEMGPDGQPDLTKPLFVLGDGTGGTEAYHLYYVVYDPGDGQTSRKLDLGYVKGRDGEAFVPDIDSVPTANSSNLVESGGVAQAIADAGTAQTAALNGAVATINTALGGKADLENGKVPVSQLPSFVSDVKEYPTAADFPEEGEAAKIYVAKDTNLTYRWSGTGYVEISQSLALGETASTAYAGNKGKANADAIAAIKDGTSIDSFADVEGALEGKYAKPATGIPATDLAAAVQTSLGKADTALQDAPVQSVNGQTGAVVLTAPDVGAAEEGQIRYDLLQIPYDPLEGEATVVDRAVNLVRCSDEDTTLHLPPSTLNKARDFFVVFDSQGASSGNKTLYIESTYGDTIEILTQDGQIPAVPKSGITVLYFSEIESNVFMLKGETIQSAVLPTPGGN